MLKRIGAGEIGRVQEEAGPFRLRRNVVEEREGQRVKVFEVARI